ncbi:capsular biosynthesis protein [Thermococcus sp. M39]|uniref:oligosaccharide flippase family protein n=1 Tax=Thermococcus sp. M39 TaxID=1638262 RepID=UPI00143A3130|nr:oligosaccharide flippase family protein [Thermococcus sp. M39]NJE06983.1 capsular biosynthesis protein [Thermococcus sp. M39]
MNSLKTVISKHGLFRDTFIMMVAVTLSNFFNYLYQLSMGRLLTPVEYGELFSLLSLLYIFSMFSMTINTSMTKFTAAYKAKGELGKVKTLLIQGTKKLTLMGTAIYLTVVLTSPFIAKFLNMNTPTPILLLFASIPFGFLLPLYQGILRGLQRFELLGVSLSSWSFFKLFFGVALVLLGFGVLGGLSGVFLAHVLGVFITVIFLRDIFTSKADGEKIELRALLNYSGMAFLAIFAYTTMWNIDVILVKHYLSPLEAGQYSAISVLGKIVLFAPAAVGMVIFPKAAEMHEKGEEHFHVLLKGLALTLLISGGIVLAYALFPEFVIKFIYGEKYLSVAPYLWRYGLAMMFFSLASVMVNYSLSINKTNISFYLLGLLATEIVLLSLGSKNIPTIINMLTGVSILMVIVLFIYIGRQK